ncbi:MAG: cold shock domain-containing protein [Acidobacteriota bacterium]
MSDDPDPEKQKTGGEKLLGIVKWYSIAKGYGFLDHDGRDVFVHHSLMVDEYRLAEGEQVRFTMIESPKGLQATSLVRLSDEDEEEAASTSRG